jgi:hypothetical protein
MRVKSSVRIPDEGWSRRQDSHLNRPVQALHRDRRLKPLITARFPFDRDAEAFALAQARDTGGCSCCRPEARATDPPTRWPHKPNMPHLHHVPHLPQRKVGGSGRLPNEALGY